MTALGSVGLRLIFMRITTGGTATATLVCVCRTTAAAALWPGSSATPKGGAVSTGASTEVSMISTGMGLSSMCDRGVSPVGISAMMPTGLKGGSGAASSYRAVSGAMAVCVGSWGRGGGIPGAAASWGALASS